MRLPNGETTESIDSYLSAWLEVSEALETMLDVHVNACNPGLSIVNPDNKNETCHLPMWIVNKILELKK